MRPHSPQPGAPKLPSYRLTIIDREFKERSCLIQGQPDLHQETLFFYELQADGKIRRWLMPLNQIYASFYDEVDE